MNKVKYPRTWHLPWSEGLTSDDRLIPTLEHLIGQEIVVTTKMDGENTTLMRDCSYARSPDSRNHPSRNWVKNFWNTFKNEIPKGYRICGENVYARHSIAYNSLPSYFLGFSIWNEENVCLSWKETLEYFELFDIVPVGVLYEGPWDESLIKSLWDPGANKEGYVVRVSGSFNIGDFGTRVAKFVRANHVQTDEHWMNAPIIPNQLDTLDFLLEGYK